jgi:hypothetical protein
MTEPSVLQFEAVLRNIRGAGLEADADPEVDEWVQVWSEYLEDQDVFVLLERRWSMIAVNGYSSFALVYCRGGPDAGVWVHHLYDGWLRDEYAYGKHTISSWW